MNGARAACGATLLLLIASGCPVAENRNPYMPPPVGTGAGGSTGMPSGDVAVVIEAPVADPIQSYARGTLVEVKAQVTIQNGTDFVDSSSVVMTLSQQGQTRVVETGQLVLASTLDGYEGRLSLGDLEGGTYTLTVVAASSRGVMGRFSVDIRIDAGPEIVINSPVEGKSYKRGITVEVVASDPFGLDGSSPTATIGAVDVALSMSGTNTFRGTIDFDAEDPPLFGPQLLTVVATNVNGRRTEKRLVFLIDNDGPQITQTFPTPGQIVGGVIQVSAVVNDTAGVLDSSVIAVVGDDTGSPKFKLSLEPAGIGVYTTLFDSGRLTECKELPDTSPCIVFPTISFRASDEVGNESVIAYDFAVDNVAPLADLDPPHVRDRKLAAGIRCSFAFDPLGVNVFDGDMPNDHTYVPQVFDLRARVEDQGNRASGLKLTPISLVDDNKTDVYILDDVTQPLIVDTDGNGSCDSINPLLIPTTEPPTTNNQVLKVRLAPVAQAGSADFQPDITVPSVPTAGWPCLRGLDPDPPGLMCLASQPTIAIGYAFGQPSIWSVEPINAQWCHGGQFDTKANNIGNGWACVAVSSTDKAGNFGVSRPLRVFIDHRPTPPIYPHNFNDDASAEPGMPTCTGRWDRATNTVTPGPCTTIKFKPNEFCYLKNCPGEPDL